MIDVLCKSIYLAIQKFEFNFFKILLFRKDVLNW